MFQGTFGRPLSLRINYFNVLLTNFTLGVKVLGVYDNAFAGIALKCPWGVAENARGTFWKLVPINLASYKIAVHCQPYIIYCSEYNGYKVLLNKLIILKGY